MTNKIVEALAMILEGINKNSSVDEINSDLAVSKGYDIQTISAAFSLIYDKLLDNSQNNLKKFQTNDKRFLTEDEKEILGLDNVNYLVFLQNLDLFDVYEFETLLDQLLLIPGESITKEDINWSVYISLLDNNRDILPGSRLLLHSSDTIN